MNANVQRLISLIPDRTARSQTGTVFLETAACRYPERLAHLSKLLHWLSPVTPITLEDQRILGLVGANGRPLSARDDDEDALPEEAEGLDKDVEVMEPEQPAEEAPSSFSPPP